MLKVLGTGQPRTGTHSLKVALEILGFQKCLHMVGLLNEYPENISFFEKARDGENVDWNTLFDKFASAVDFPVALYYQSILKAYPNAKVVHTTRDPEAWYKSISDTIFKIHQQSFSSDKISPEVQKRLPVLIYAKKMVKDVYGDDYNDKDTVIEAFKKHNEEVLKTVPKDQLLIYNVREGWEPLCAFLEKPIPTVPFPKTNSTSEFLKNAAGL